MRIRNILQQLKLLLYKDLMSKLLSYRVRFHEGSSPGVSPGVYEPRPCPLNGTGIPAHILIMSSFYMVQTAI